MDTSVEAFHSHCMNNFDIIKCPVCYQARNPSILKNATCMKCSANESLWFCITCGYTCCGQAESNHAVDHYRETKHQYAMKLEGFQLFDYTERQFVHKLNDHDLELLEINQRYALVNDGDNCACLVCMHTYAPKLKDIGCMVCGIKEKENLWICMSCNYTGCSTNKNAHALAHYEGTKHRYALLMGTWCVWDYMGETYLHRHDSKEHKVEVKETVLEGFVKHLGILERLFEEFREKGLQETHDLVQRINEGLIILGDDMDKLSEKVTSNDTKLDAIITQLESDKESEESLPIQEVGMPKATDVQVSLEGSQTATFAPSRRNFVTSIFYAFGVCFQKFAEVFWRVVRFFFH